LSHEIKIPNVAFTTQIYNITILMFVISKIVINNAKAKEFFGKYSVQDKKVNE
jgi:hypothetical protein